MPIEKDEVEALFAAKLKEYDAQNSEALAAHLAQRDKAHKEAVASYEAKIAALEAKLAGGSGAAGEGDEGEAEPPTKGTKRVVNKDDVAKSQRLATLESKLREVEEAKTKAEQRALDVARTTAINEQLARVGITSPVMRQAALGLIASRVKTEDGAFYVERQGKFGSPEAMTLEAYIDEWIAGEGKDLLPPRQGAGDAGPAGVRRPGALASKKSAEDLRKIAEAKFANTFR